MTKTGVELAYEQFGGENEVSDLLVKPELLFDIFRTSLADHISDKLFDPDIAPSRRLVSKDFKDAEKRRIILRKGKGVGRLYAGTQFAMCVSSSFDEALTRKPDSVSLEEVGETVAALEIATKGYRSIPHKEWTEHQLDSLVELEIQKDLQKKLSDIVRIGGDGFPNQNVGYAKRVFAYQILHQTFCLFGDGENTSGKNSGRGLPSLCAKISNLLFPDSAKFSAREVSVIYKRSSKRIRDRNMFLLSLHEENDS